MVLFFIMAYIVFYNIGNNFTIADTKRFIN